MIEHVNHDSVALEHDVIDEVRRQLPAQPCEFERVSGAHLPEVARIRVGNGNSWFIWNGGDIGNDASTNIWTL